MIQAARTDLLKVAKVRLVLGAAGTNKLLGEAKTRTSAMPVNQTHPNGATGIGIRVRTDAVVRSTYFTKIAMPGSWAKIAWPINLSSARAALGPASFLYLAALAHASHKPVAAQSSA